MIWSQLYLYFKIVSPNYDKTFILMIYQSILFFLVWQKQTFIGSWSHKAARYCGLVSHFTVETEVLKHL